MDTIIRIGKYNLRELNMDNETKATMAGAVGVTVGTAGSVGTIAAAGTVAGLGATGITSGLAAVGGVVGGGMATGLVVAAAAPLAIGAIGYFVFKKLFK